MISETVAAVASVSAAAKGIHIRGASAVLLLVVVILAIAGVVYAIRRFRGSEESTDRPDEWPQSQRGPKDPSPWP